MSFFLMEHAAFLESLVWRARQGVEAAYLCSYNFVSLMYEMSDCVSQCLMEFFTGPCLTSSLWLSLSNSCDNVSDNKTSTHLHETVSWNSRTNTEVSGNKFCSALNVSCNSDDSANGSNNFTFLNIASLLKNNPRECCGESYRTAECFLSELCELLETVDVKHTNL